MTRGWSRDVGGENTSNHGTLRPNLQEPDGRVTGGWLTSRGPSKAWKSAPGSLVGREAVGGPGMCGRARVGVGGTGRQAKSLGPRSGATCRHSLPLETTLHLPAGKPVHRCQLGQRRRHPPRRASTGLPKRPARRCWHSGSWPAQPRGTQRWIVLRRTKPTRAVLKPSRTPQRAPPSPADCSRKARPFHLQC